MNTLRRFFNDHHYFFISTTLLIFSSHQVYAAGEFPAQARLYAGYLPIAPANLNANLTAAGLKTFASYYQGGVEITYPVHSLLNIGLRYSHRLAYAVENPSNAATEYYGGIAQDVMVGVARINAFKSKFLRIDGFAGLGGGKASFQVKTVDQNGSLSQSDPMDWLASPIYTLGASAGVGYKNFFLYVEGGYEKNSVTRLKSSGTISSTESTIALSGNYIAIGLMFDGITATQQ